MLTIVADPRAVNPKLLEVCPAFGRMGRKPVESSLNSSFSKLNHHPARTPPLFFFDGDGIQTYDSTAGNDPTGSAGMTSAGEYTTFTNISPSQNTGAVVFGASGIPDGGTAYFSLEWPPDVNLKPTSARP